MMKQQVRFLLFALALTLGFGSLKAQDEVLFQIVSSEQEVQTGSKVYVTVRGIIAPGWHLYSMDVPPGGPIPTQITVEESDAFAPGGAASEPTPTPWFDQNFGMETNYFEDEVDFQVPVLVKATAPVGEQELQLKVRFMLCNDSSCLPPQTKKVTKTFSVVPGTASAQAAEAGEAPSEQGEGRDIISADDSSEAAVPAESADVDQRGLPINTLAYIWFAMTMGALALLTPCVFPMIPITVSYFTKREAKTRGRAVFEAGLYSIGIIGTFTVLGFGLTYAFGAGGINKLAASPWVNSLIALIFIVFALSLFGVIELSVPNSWLNAINRKSSQSSGVVGIFLMALTFSLTSFTCTVPFVGTVMVAALQGDWLWSLIGVASFATVFSLPFFLLALFPKWLQSLPKSGNWMNAVKITMGFLELAAALKFISNVDLVFQWEFLTRPVFITVWLAIAILLTFYLLGWFRFRHETATDSVGAVRVMFAIVFLSISFYLLRGLFGFSLGELDAFLPPRDYGAVSQAGFISGAAAGPEEAHWYSDYEEALAEAQRLNKPLFIDFTGYTCTNCRWMEANVFPLPEVQELFDRYVLVRLYTDGTEEEHERNRQMEQDRFHTIALPYYALITPRDETIATFPGLTRNSDEFVEFLRKGVQ